MGVELVVWGGWVGGELGCSDRATCSLFEISESRWAGLRRSIDTLSLRLLIVMVKCLSVLLITG